eukprot:Plantae.Rhodophyta-Purpureofilum_apyrenoidigerum.ctg44016.p1 GENE.Plantae.Rhodophyta-Purpureofilum_apyrenoidigerum.ctg44016~~Plantae.Rhodophyta-Purpureofilum_apyrenoidigerum.ctg44016.p1  ORF type:complete len:224 (+),score=25.42 Plantae.Rhodophyta-Purpureofilum_apyrenoidigerum.ctg44016:72-743(+)
MLFRSLTARARMAAASSRSMASLQPQFVLEPEVVAEIAAERASRQDRSEFDASSVDRTVLVRNLNVSTQPHELREAFESVGEVLFVDVLRRHSGKSLGRAIVEYADRDSALRALQTLSGTPVGGLNVIVERTNRLFGAYTEPVVTRRIQVSSLPRSILQKDLHWIGEHFGDVVETRMLVGKDRRTTNIGTVLFRRIREAHYACKILDGRQLDGKVLEANFVPE